MKSIGFIDGLGWFGRSKGELSRDCSISETSQGPLCGVVRPTHYDETMKDGRIEKERMLKAKVAGGFYPVASMKRGCAQIAAGTHEVQLGGPCRGRTYGPLMTSSAENIPQHTQDDELADKIEGER